MFEAQRQLVHLSGLFFIILVQFVGREIGVSYFLLIALFFLFYSWYIRREEKKLGNFLKRFESGFREFVLKFERKESMTKPFTGAFYFYFGCALAFFLFPFNIASVACSILAVGDSFSTLFGLKLGKHKIYGKKTLEGSLGCFSGSVLGFLIISFFLKDPVMLPVALLGAVTATLAELIPKIDDNLTIPLISGFVMFLAGM